MEDLTKELKEIVTSFKQYMDFEKEAGCHEFMVAKKAVAPGKKAALDSLRREIGDCRKCELADSRTRLVFGEGSPQAELMFVGEAPGRDEDREGRPFVGRAGKLLTKIIEAMGLKRSDVFIGNILKCRPPDNRNPHPQEIIACREHLLRQIETIKPKVICCLGRFAIQVLLNTESPISKLRGRFHEFGDTKVMPTFHPAYLLRNPNDKRLVWNDMKKVMAELGLSDAKKVR